ncbi:hypothetical protein KOW79_012144 [Hemibagrus wyckioides]|uniref:Uncharacterized protein n=1 Tax=Hemibagrus wyckioides TaxID=337641 RepID=A0A9D3NJL5_9TELE|nr:hypothetical protein KOW79_012144 [Hemibagrus wyckioides]
MSAVLTSVAEIPVRPLQLAVGAAATATGTYYYVKQTTGEIATTPGDPVFEQALVQATEVLRAQMMMHEREQDANRILKEEIDRMKKTLYHEEEILKMHEREQDANRILQEENDRMKKTLYHEEEILKVSLAEAEEQHQKDVEYIAQLEQEKFDLTEQVTVLNDNLNEITQLISIQSVECANLTKDCVQDWEKLLEKDYRLQVSVES